MARKYLSGLYQLSSDGKPSLLTEGPTEVGLETSQRPPWHPLGKNVLPNQLARGCWKLLDESGRKEALHQKPYDCRGCWQIAVVSLQEKLKSVTQTFKVKVTHLGCNIYRPPQSLRFQSALHFYEFHCLLSVCRQVSIFTAKYR